MSNVIITIQLAYITRTWHTDNDLRPYNGALSVYKRVGYRYPIIRQKVVLCMIVRVTLLINIRCL